MERRDIAKALAVVIGGTLTGTAIATQKKGIDRIPDNLATPFMKRNIKEKLEDTISVLDFGSYKNASEAFYLAFLYLNHRGGGNLLVPNGNYSFDKTVRTRIGCKISIYTSSNAILTINNENDMFDITGSDNAALRFFGNGEFIYNGPETNNSACIRFLSLSTKNKSANSSFECNGRMRFKKGNNEWKYALHLTNVRDGIIDGPQFDGLVSGEKLSKQECIYIEAKDAPSVSWVISNIQINDVGVGFKIINNVAPGVEGLKFFNCDLGGVTHGVVYENNTSYYPPQIEFIGCHMNGYNSLLKLNKIINIHIIGGLYYRSGSDRKEIGSANDNRNAGAFLEFSDVLEVSIVGTGFTITNKKTEVPCISINGTTIDSSFYRVSDCHFWAHGSKAPFIKLKGRVAKINLSNCTKDTGDGTIQGGGKWIDSQEVAPGYGNIYIDKDTIAISVADKGTLWGQVIGFKNGVLDIKQAQPGIVYVKSDDGINEIKKIIGGRLGATYLLRPHSENIIFHESRSLVLFSGKDKVEISAGKILKINCQFDTYIRE